MQNLAGGMHPGVRPAGDHHRFGWLGPGRLFGEGVFDDALDGATTRLLGPAREVCAVVGNVEPETDQGAFSPRKAAPGQTDEPAIPGGSSGLVRYGFRRQDSSSDDSAASSSAFARCDGGSWKPAFSAASSLSNQTSATVCS